MQPKTDGKPGRRTRIIANLLVVITAVWLLVYLMPAGRAMMLDAALSFALGLLVTGLLWWAVYESVPSRCFWTWLAAAWTVGLLGNIAWGLYELLSGTALPPLSWVDGFYLVRYALVLVAFWRCLGVPARRQWLHFFGVLLAATAAAAVGALLTVPASRLTIVNLSGVFYAVLDLGLIYVALRAWWQEPAGGLRNALGLLSLALVAYGIANWLNFFGQAIPSDTAVHLAAFFWPLSDILTSAGVLHLLWTADSAASAS